MLLNFFKAAAKKMAAERAANGVSGFTIRKNVRINHPEDFVYLNPYITSSLYTDGKNTTF